MLWGKGIYWHLKLKNSQVLIMKVFFFLWFQIIDFSRSREFWLYSPRNSHLASFRSILTSKDVLFAEEWPLGCNMALDILNSVKWWYWSISNSHVSALFKNPVGKMAIHISCILGMLWVLILNAVHKFAFYKIRFFS